MNESGQDRRETLADIVAELRALSKCDEYSVQAKYAELQPTVCGKPILLYFAEIADRIEAAAKREKAETETDALAVGGVVEAARHTPGNAAALRDAVIKALTLLNVCDWPPGVSLDGVGEVIREIDSVLDKPPRNCDVGTAHEQESRFHTFCNAHHNCAGCPHIALEECALAWAQMPFAAEEGGNND